MNESETQEPSEQIPSKGGPRSSFAMASTSDSSPKLEGLILQAVNSSSLIGKPKKANESDKQHTKLEKFVIFDKNLQTSCRSRTDPLKEVAYCKQHSILSSPNVSSKSISNQISRNNSKNSQTVNQNNVNSSMSNEPQQPSIDLGGDNSAKQLLLSEKVKQKSHQNQNLVVPAPVEWSASSNENESSEDSSSEESQVRRGLLTQSKLGKNVSQESEQQLYPLQFVCVELSCGETSKLCCAKCLSSGVHEGHEAICVKTLSSQIRQSVTGNKLTQVREKIERRLSDLVDKISQVKDSFMQQYEKGFEFLQAEAEKVLNSDDQTTCIDKQVAIWKAYFQPDQADIMDHLVFIAEQGDIFFNQAQSRILNLNPQQLLHVRKLSCHDLLFRAQLKELEDELAKAEQGLSIRAKQTIAVLPQFEFQSLEYENFNAIALKKFEFPERIEFCQVDKQGEQNGRCLIFWRDGAFRIGYHRNGYSQGVCRMIWENGNLYQGPYVSDHKSGHGLFVKFTDNSSYFGQFEDDAKNGHGIEYYRNDTHYVGSFKNWKPHGQGELINTHTKKILKSGKWKSGKHISDQLS